jgi:hypothetical protein
VHAKNADISGRIAAAASLNNVVAIALGRDAFASIGAVSVEGQFSGSLSTNTVASNSVAIGLGRLSRASIGGADIH